MTQEEPKDIEEVSDGDLEEVKKEPEYKEASTPKDLWETFLERRKVAPTPTAVGHGGGDACMGNAQCTGTDPSTEPTVADDFNLEADKQTKTYIEENDSKGSKNE